VGRLAALEGDEFTPEVLVALGIVKKLGDGLKVLGSGDIARPIQVQAHLFSKSAQEKIQAAGGSVKVIEKAKASE
jgi:large subunit ribosomal protein L15